jgi:hypothetical protein
MRNIANVIGGKPNAVQSQSISGVSAIYPLVAFYDIHARKREVLLFYFVPDATRANKPNIKEIKRRTNAVAFIETYLFTFLSILCD